MLNRRPMPVLHGLRFNCWLVPLTLATTAAAGMVGTEAWRAERAAAIEGATLARSLATGGRRSGPVDASALAALRGIDQGWRGLSRLGWNAERFQSVAGIGATDVDLAMPLPELIAAVHAAQYWRADDGDWLVAAPIVEADGLTSGVLLGRHVVTAAPAWGCVGLATGAVFALAAALGAYLVRHLHHPVEALQRAAEAAMTGEPEGEQALSEETSACASSVHALASRYRSSVTLPVRSGD